MRSTRIIKLSLMSALNLAFMNAEDHSERILRRAARGLVACFEANGGALIHNSYDESGTCGPQYVPEESIWVRESNNPTITAIVNDTFVTAEGAIWVDGMVHFVASDGRRCQFSLLIDASEEDVLVRVRIPVICQP